MNIDASIQLSSSVSNFPVPDDARVLEKVVSRCKTPLIEVIQRGFALYSALPPVAQQSSNGARTKMPPLREFAQEHGLALSTYWRLISTYLLYRRFPEIAHYRHLGVAHLSVILGVEEECQLYFIRMTEICRWSRRVRITCFIPNLLKKKGIARINNVSETCEIDMIIVEYSITKESAYFGKCLNSSKNTSP